MSGSGGAAGRGFAAVPPPSPPAGPPTGPLRAVPLGQPGPSAAAGQGSAAVPPPPPPRPGPPPGPLRAVPLCQPGPSAAAGQGSAAVPPPPPSRPGPPTGPLRAVPLGQSGPSAGAGQGSAAKPPPPPPRSGLLFGPLRAVSTGQSGPRVAGDPQRCRRHHCRSMARCAPTGPTSRPRYPLLWGPPQRGLHRLQLPTAIHAPLAAAAVRHGAATSRLPGLRLRPRHPLQPCHRRRRPPHCRACRQAQGCSPGLRRRSPASLAGRRR